MFEHYITSGGKRLRMGYTTGASAAVAAAAAAEAAITGHAPSELTINTPRGLSVTIPIDDPHVYDRAAECTVIKDAGDDPDVTDGARITARVTLNGGKEIIIDGGAGVGRVTKPGLDQPVGAAAINSVPRRMIHEAVSAVFEALGYTGGAEVIISVLDGDVIAERTFNPKLGIVGGISILGTSGIVEPKSVKALIDCIGLELSVLAASGRKSVILTPGNYGEAFLSKNRQLAAMPHVKYSNYPGAALDFAVEHGFRTILVVGHAGKLIKLAGGIMSTHSREADCRIEIIMAHAALCGASQEIVHELFSAVTTDACIDILMTCGLCGPVIRSVMGKMQEHLGGRCGGDVAVGAVMFTNTHGYLGETDTATEIIETILREGN